MVLEVLVVQIKPGTMNDFESDFRKASKFLTTMKGYISHELQKCIQEKDKYMVLIRWESLKDHTLAFRLMEEYKDWQELLEPFYQEQPLVQHYVNINVNG
jgi:heme-degrading monooxygenase HmoA